MNADDSQQIEKFFEDGLITADQKKRIERQLENGSSLHEAISKTPIIDPLKLQLRLSSVGTRKPTFDKIPESKKKVDNHSFLKPSEQERQVWLGKLDKPPILALDGELPQIKAMENMIETLQGFVGISGGDFKLVKTQAGFAWVVTGNTGKEWMRSEFTEKDGGRFLLQLLIAARLSPHMEEKQEGCLIISQNKSIPFLLRSENARESLYGFRLAESV